MFCASVFSSLTELKVISSPPLHYYWILNSSIYLTLLEVYIYMLLCSVQSLSHVWLTLCDPMDCSSPTPRAYSNSCPLSRCCHPTISSSVIPFSSHLQSFPSIRVFSNELALPMVAKVCIRPFNEYSGLISFRMEWLDLLAVEGTLKSLLQHLVQKHQFGTQPSL